METQSNTAASHNNENSIAWKYVFGAALIDVLGSSIAGGIIGGISVIRSDVFPNIPTDPNQFVELMNRAPYHQLSLFFGVFFSVYAGYLAARWAKRQEFLHGALSSILCVLSGLISLIFGAFSFIGLCELAISPLLGLAGGYIAQKRKKK